MYMQIINRCRNNPIAIESGAAMLVILSLLAGWKLGAMQFFTISRGAVPFYQPYSQIQAVAPLYSTRGWDMLSPAIILFILAYIAAYATPPITKMAGWTRQTGNDGRSLTAYAQNICLALACTQALPAGLIVNYTRLLSTRYGHGATEAIMIMAALTLVPTAGTYLMRLWGPRWSLMLMPVVMLGTIYSLSPTAYPSGYLENGLTKQFQEAAGPIKEMFKAISSYSGFLKGITGTFINTFGIAALVGGVLYIFMRPMSVMNKWHGQVCGAAFNGIIVMYIATMPYIMNSKEIPFDWAMSYRLADACRFTKDNSLGYIAWSWMIGNAISIVYMSFKYAKKHNTMGTSQMQTAGVSDAQVTANAKPRKRLPATPERESRLLGSLYGQEDALQNNLNVLKEMDAGQRSIGVSLLLGPTGVGKTETAKKIAEVFFEGRLVRYDMNQYTSQHEASRLFGSPQGYVGSDQGGDLVTDLINNAPCVVLLDEIEKVHPTILKTLLQFIEGQPVKDALQRSATAQGCFIIMTSNAMPERSAELSTMTAQKVRELLKNYTTRTAEGNVAKIFAPEFIGRIHYIIPYKPITREVSERILDDMVNQKAIDSNFSVADGSVKSLTKLIDPSEGFRGIKNAFTTLVESFLHLDNSKSLRGLRLSINVKAGDIIFALTDRSGATVKSKNTKLNRTAIDPKLIAGLPEYLAGQVVGQESALTALCAHLKIASAGALPNVKKPLGIFLLPGPSGVGKTETAKALAQYLFGGRLIKKDMGEYKHATDSRRLFGDRHTPGELTQEVSELGSCVILLDEVEKADPEVFDAMLALFDDGEMQDAASSIRVSFRNTVIIMTTNLLSNQAAELWSRPDEEKKDLLAQFFRTEFLGRVDKILFYQPLSQNILHRIVRKRVAEMVDRYEGFGINITVKEDVYAAVCRKVQVSAYGSRALDKVIKDTVAVALADIPEGADTIELWATDAGKVVITAAGRAQ
jgi:ATP-dependent Clp protease ATP-binding subunit ClpA